MSVMKHVGLFLLPISVTAVGAAWYLDLFAQEAPESVVVEKAQALAKPVMPMVKAKFESLSYPDEPQLAQLERDWPTAELSQDYGTFVDQNYAANNAIPGEQDLLEPSQQTVKTSASMQSHDDLGLSLDDLDLSSLSPDLALKVESALSNNDQPSLNSSSSVGDLEREARQWHGRLPALNLQTHMYSSDANRRWVKINNVEYHQGDVVDGQVTLKEIQPQAVIVEFQGEQIRIPALYEWKG
ncbi:Type II secretion system protein B [Vibrio sp. B1FIG11]|uniref:general secretion pathway protein GspB n=1 Tax=Vibrio sp. B1FIG11 TaxID=2751177 RepID=UPI0015F5939D|nr:general secretion pathway protein GspB [Vibrio sp. B1FIG11]CAE6884028.1 Type II secretion system protein B [Vibrio sp. B1FIG11]